MKYGWKTILSYSNPKMISAMEWIRKGGTGRAFVEQQVGDGMVEFYFREGQSCFDKHYVQDFVFDIGKRNTNEARTLWYPDGDAFVEDSDNHLRKIKEVVDNG